MDTENIKAKLSFDLDDIYAFRESYDDDGIPDGTIVYAKAGDSFFIVDKYDTFYNFMTHHRDVNKQETI